MGKLDDDAAELAALLERATQVEVKDVPVLDLDALDAADGAPADSAADLAEQVRELREQIELLAAATPEGADPAVDAEADLSELDADENDDDVVVPEGTPLELTPEDQAQLNALGITDDGEVLDTEGKAAGFLPCTECGGTGVEQTDDGPVCEDCGEPVASAGPDEGKGYDFVDTDDDALVPVDDLRAEVTRRYVDLGVRLGAL